MVGLGTEYQFYRSSKNGKKKVAVDLANLPKNHARTYYESE
jgi:hypothetical protein